MGAIAVGSNPSSGCHASAGGCHAPSAAGCHAFEAVAGRSVPRSLGDSPLVKKNIIVWCYKTKFITQTLF